MEYETFDKEQLSILADIIIDKLKTLPDNSELSLTDLLIMTFDAEYISCEGHKLSDICLNGTQYLHDIVGCNLDNTILFDGFGTEYLLDKIVKRKAVAAGYIVDHSQKWGKLGMPHNIPSFYRKKKEFVSSFKGLNETEIKHKSGTKYYIKHREEKVHYHKELYDGYYTEIVDYDNIHKPELWRIPQGCSTGRIKDITGCISFYVISGRCFFESSSWQHGVFWPQKRATWKELKIQRKLRGNQNERHRSENKCKKDGTILIPSWYKLTNIGKSDLLIYVIDAKKTETIRMPILL